MMIKDNAFVGKNILKIIRQLMNLLFKMEICHQLMFPIIGVGKVKDPKEEYVKICENIYINNNYYRIMSKSHKK